MAYLVRPLVPASQTVCILMIAVKTHQSENEVVVSTCRVAICESEGIYDAQKWKWKEAISENRSAGKRGMYGGRPSAFYFATWYISAMKECLRDREFTYRTIASVTVPLTNLLLSSAARYDILVVSVTCAAVPRRIVETIDHHARVLAPESRSQP